MRLLLVLSAFLTALVGLGAVPAAARPASEVCASATARHERQAPRVAVTVSTAPTSLDKDSFAPVILARAPVRAVPLYAERLRV